MVSPVLRARRRAYSALLAMPALHEWRLEHMRGRLPWHLADENTRLVIEGAPRCANSYAVAAFCVANGWGGPNGTPGLAHHTHAPASVLRAIRLGRPALVIIRNPEAAALSRTIYSSGVTVEDALRDYIAFYRRILPVRTKIAVADFETVVSDFGSVIKMVNDRFGTTFRRYERTPENEERCRRMLERWALHPNGEVNEALVGRPSSYREQLSDRLRPSLERPRTKRLLETAERVYRQFVG